MSRKRPRTEEEDRVRFIRAREIWNRRKGVGIHPDHDWDIELTLLAMRDRLADCLGIEFSIDHIVPLGRGGPHHHTNLRAIPHSLNVRKGDKLDAEMKNPPFAA